MKIPTIEEVTAYIQFKGYEIDPETFWHFYNSKGWKVGKEPMKSWRSACVTWTRTKMNKTKLFPIKGRTCGKRDCGMPAIYKSIGGSHDHFTCGEHMPDKVKEKYC